MALKIAYSEGHGKHTPGKRTPAGEREWNFNHLMGEGFKEEIQKYSDVLIRLVSDPTGERDVPLTERTDISNSWGADVYVAFHHNAYRGIWGTHTGTETFTYNRDWYRSWKQNNHDAEKRLARVVNDAIIKVYGLYDRGIKQANFHEVREPHADAVLAEGGYMDSSIDIKVMRDQNKVKEAGRQVARDVAKLYGLKLKGGKPAQTVSGTIYRVQVGAFSKVANAASLSQEVEKKTGFSTYIVDDAGDGITRVQVGAFAVKANAENRLKELKKHYKDAFMTTNGTNAIPVAEPQNEPAQKPVDINQLVKDTLAGKYGNSEARKKNLGQYYNQVQAIINGQSPSASRKTTQQLVDEVMRGEHGNGDARKKSLGSRYNEVMDVINGQTSKAINKGSKVKLKSTAQRYATGELIPSSVKNKTYTVQETGTRNGKKQVLLKEIVSWVWESDVQ